MRLESRSMVSYWPDQRLASKINGSDLPKLMAALMPKARHSINPACIDTCAYASLKTLIRSHRHPRHSRDFRSPHRSPQLYRTITVSGSQLNCGSDEEEKRGGVPPAAEAANASELRAWFRPCKAEAKSLVPASWVSAGVQATREKLSKTAGEQDRWTV